jgi:hypothetical protein
MAPEKIMARQKMKIVTNTAIASRLHPLQERMTLVFLKIHAETVQLRIASMKSIA